MVDITQPEPWDRAAKGYADAIAERFEPYAREALRQVSLADGEKVLDVATGPGTLALVAAERAHVTAVDFSPEMVAMVQARAADRGIVGVETRVADGQALPFEDARFDAAFSMFGLFMFPDRAAGFRELARVLRPGGRAVVASWVPREPEHPFNLVGQLLAELTPSAPGPAEGGGMPLSDPDELHDEMAAAGFDVTVARFEHRVSFASASAVADSMLRAHVGLVMLEAERSDVYAEVARTLDERLNATLGEGSVEVPLAAWLAMGVRQG